jgi:hypothetical protein
MSTMERVLIASIDPYHYTKDILYLRENNIWSSESYFPLGFNGIYNYVFYDYSKMIRE